MVYSVRPGPKSFKAQVGSPFTSSWSGNVPVYNFISIIRHSEFSIHSLTYSNPRPDTYRGFVSIGNR